MEEKEVRKEVVHRKGSDIVWALFLVFIGVIFLLNTTGVVGWGVWLYIFRFWPIFLVLAGIKLLIGRSVVAEIALSILALVMFLFIGVFSYLTYTTREVSFLPDFVNRCVMGDCGDRFFTTGTVVEEEFVVSESEYEDVQKRNIDLNIGAAKFTVSDDSSSDFLKVDARYTEGILTPSLDTSRSGDILEMEFTTSSRARIFPFFSTSMVSEFGINIGRPSLNTDLNIDLGAGEGSVELNEVSVGDIGAHVGAGKLTLDLSGNSITTGTVTVDVGAGELVLQLPENTGYEISYDLGVGEITVDGDSLASFAGSADNVRSDNYESADAIVKIVAHVGVGSLVINTK